MKKIINEIVYPIVVELAGWLENVVNWLDGLPSEIKKNIVVIVLVVAALWPILMIVGFILQALAY